MKVCVCVGGGGGDVLLFYSADLRFMKVSSRRYDNKGAACRYVVFIARPYLFHQ